MDFELIRNYFQDKLKHRDYSTIEKSSLSVHFPVHEGILNLFVANIIASSQELKDFKSLVFSELNNNRFAVHINHRKINRTLRCEIHDIGFNDYSEVLIIIKFIDGLRMYEKIAINSALAIKKRWNWFKSQMNDSYTAETKKNSAIDFSSKGLIINVTHILKQQGFDYLIPLVEWKDITTKGNRLIFDLNIII